MKTAISIDNDLFKIAELTAQNMGVSRSKLFSLALREYIEHHNPQEITQSLNIIYGYKSNSLPSELSEMQAQSLNTEEW